MGASGAFSAVLNDLTNLPQAVTDAQEARDAALAAQTAAEDAAAAAALSNPGAPGGTAQLDAESKLLESQVPDRLTEAAQTAAFDAEVTRADAAYVAQNNLLPLLYKPQGLRRFRVALGDAVLGVVKRPVVAVLGDSLSKGAYSNNLTNAAETQFATFRQRGFATQLRNLLAAKYGVTGGTGEGFVFMVTPTLDATCYENRVTISGSSASGTVGPQKSGRSITSGQTITVTSTEACDAIEVHAWWSDGVSAPWSYTIDGGAPVAVAARSGSDTLYTETITGLADTTHTIVISGPATLRADIGGVSFLRGTKGVVVHNLGWGGHTIVHASANDLSAASQTRVLNATTTQLDVDLLVVMFRHNDGAASLSKATFKDAIQDICTHQAARGGCTLLVPDPAGNVAWDLEQYYDAMIEVADATDHVAVLNFDHIWGGFTAANGLGMYQDTIHPNSRGHGDMARIYEQVLTGPGLGPVVA